MTVKVAGAAGVAVYELPADGGVHNDAIVALAVEAMSDAAATVTGDVAMHDLSAKFHVPEAAGTLRAEAIVMRMRGTTVRVAADILAGDLRVASFEADTAAA